jgi:hypothetical protein
MGRFLETSILNALSWSRAIKFGCQVVVWLCWDWGKLPSLFTALDDQLKAHVGLSPCNIVFLPCFPSLPHCNYPRLHHWDQAGAWARTTRITRRNDRSQRSSGFLCGQGSRVRYKSECSNECKQYMPRAIAHAEWPRVAYLSQTNEHVFLPLCLHSLLASSATVCSRVGSSVAPVTHTSI